MAAQSRTRRNAGWSLPRKPAEWGIWLILAFMFLFYLLPVYVMVNNGLKEAQGVSLSTMWNLPATLSGGGFQEAWERLRPNMFNSLLMVIPATIISAFIGAINGYLLAKWKFRGSDILFTIMLFGFFIPYQAILIPLVTFLQWIKVYGTLWGLILVHVVYGLPITTLIFRNYFAGVPTELLEAARVDGAGLMT
ncbi:MAG TPA: carbohydrate ABC transporter permease, partial [Anaerolineae bacterium]|nr:carbohydrate ABC transporter permease [Anaerolineae bacterium]